MTKKKAVPTYGSFVLVTRLQGAGQNIPVFINTALITQIINHEGRTQITLQGGGNLDVAERPEDILKQLKG